MIEVYYPSYFKGEAAAVGLLKERLEKLFAHPGNEEASSQK
jgi:hypothetical protein